MMPPTATGPSWVAFEYATIRAVPRVEREEFLNVGVIVYCQARAFLDAAVDVNADRLRALDPAADTAAIEASAASFLGSHRRNNDSNNLSAAFGWLTAPRSTVIQTGPVHPGMTEDPAAELRRLMNRLVH